MKAERKKKNYTIVMQEDLLRASREPIGLSPDRLPEEYEKCLVGLVGLNAITVEAWGYPAADTT